MDMMGDARRDVNGGDVSAAGGQVLGVMETAFRASERLLWAPA